MVGDDEIVLRIERVSRSDHEFVLLVRAPEARRKQDRVGSIRVQRAIGLIDQPRVGKRYAPLPFEVGNEQHGMVETNR